MLELRAGTRDGEHRTSVDATFAAAVLVNLAALVDDGVEDESLALPLSLSLVMRRCGISHAEAIVTLLALRDALVDAGELDGTSEPVPLLHPDARTTLLLLAHYLVALLARAAATTHSTAAGLAAVAAGHFHPALEPERRHPRLVGIVEANGS